jgi:tetratricopeptide (TPR) repeat protein
LWAAAAAHYHAGWSLYRLKRYSEAALEFEKSVHIDPKHTPTYNALGTTYRHTGELAFAEKAFKEELRRAPSDMVYLKLERVYVEQGDVTKAVELLKKASALYPNSLGIQMELSSLSQSLK